MEVNIMNTCSSKTFSSTVADPDVAFNWKNQKKIVDLLFAFQFVFFTLFGIVNLLTLNAIHKQINNETSVEDDEIRTVWGNATKRYSILSIVVKTFLEIFFFMYVLTNPSGSP